MSYRIEYDPGKGKYEVTRAHPWRFLLILAGTFGVFCLLASCFWPEGTAALRSLLIPGEDSVTVQGIRNIVADLRSGATVYDAVEAFCRFVIHE